MQVYTGKKDCSQPEHSLGYRIVSDLVGNLQGKIITSFVTIFFTSVLLAEDLLAKNLYLSGSTHLNRTDFPADLKPNKQAVKALRPGNQLFSRKGTLWQLSGKTRRPCLSLTRSVMLEAMKLFL